MEVWNNWERTNYWSGLKSYDGNSPESPCYYLHLYRFEGRKAEQIGQLFMWSSLKWV